MKICRLQVLGLSILRGFRRFSSVKKVSMRISYVMGLRFKR